VLSERQILEEDQTEREPKISSAVLFARWFWVVYVPLGLFVTLLLVAFAGLLPKLAIPVLLIVSVWSAVAVRLLFERSRRGLEVPVPKNLVGGLSWVAGLASTGAVLGWMGLARLSSDLGLLLGFTGVFLMVLALIAPVFKLVDVIIRTGARTVLSRMLRARKPAALEELPAAEEPREEEEPPEIIITRYVPPVRRPKPRPRPRPPQQPAPEVEETPPLRVGAQRR
jgi:hypothetical protein